MTLKTKPCALFFFGKAGFEVRHGLLNDVATFGIERFVSQEAFKGFNFTSRIDVCTSTLIEGKELLGLGSPVRNFTAVVEDISLFDAFTKPIAPLVPALPKPKLVNAGESVGVFGGKFVINHFGPCIVRPLHIVGFFDFVFIGHCFQSYQCFGYWFPIKFFTPSFIFVKKFLINSVVQILNCFGFFKNCFCAFKVKEMAAIHNSRQACVIAPPFCFTNMKRKGASLSSWLFPLICVSRHRNHQDKGNYYGS